MSALHLIPGNWLYNAGVIGFLRVMASTGEDVESWLQEDGSVQIPSLDVVKNIFYQNNPVLKDTIFEKFSLYWWAYLENTIGHSPDDPDKICRPLTVGELLKKMISESKDRNKKLKKIKKIKVDTLVDMDRNKIPIGEIDKQILKEYNETVQNNNDPKERKVDPCAIFSKSLWYSFVLYRYFRKGLGTLNDSYRNMVNNSIWENLPKVLEAFRKIEPLSEYFHKDAHRGVCFFCNSKTSVVYVDYMFSSNLFPANGFPNAKWNNETSIEYCDWCRFFLVHQHIGTYSLQPKQKLFLNAPSFKLMWYLNKVGREIFSRKGSQNLQELFGTTLMEMSLRYQLALGYWTAMNVEVVTLQQKQKQNNVEFFSIPADRVLLLTHPRIAFLLKSLGDLTYLQWVMDGQESRLNEETQRLLRDAFAKNEESNRKRAMILLELYTHIRDIQKQQGGVHV